MSIKWRWYRWYRHTSFSPQPRNGRYKIQQALKQCCRTRDLELGKRLHNTVTYHCLHSDVFLSNTLIEFYRKCGKMKLAQEVFERTPEKNAVTWSCMILGYVEYGESSMALHLLTAMDCQPDCVTCLSALKACANVVTENKSRRREILHKATPIYEIIKSNGYDSNLSLMNTLVDLYSKCRDMRSAKQVFDGMLYKTVVSWNCLILGYVRTDEYSHALEAFTDMDCQPDSVTYTAVVKAYTGLASEKKTKEECQDLLKMSSGTHEDIKKLGLESDMFLASALVDMYSKLREMKLASEIFERMVHQDVVAWNSLILGYVENRESAKALEVFNRMDCAPNHVTYTGVLKACAALADRRDSSKSAVLLKGMEIHGLIRECSACSKSEVIVSLMEMYSKLGRMELSKDVFDRAPYRHVCMWNVLLEGYVENGENATAFEVFHKMDCRRDHRSYAAAIKACVSLFSSNRRLALEEASAIQARAEECFLGSVAITIVNMLVDMYCKCREMGTASTIFKNMVQKNVASWNTLILGYVRNGECATALDVFSRMDCRPSAVTYVAILKACTELYAQDRTEGSSKGGDIHEQVKGDGLELELYVGSGLIGMYSAFGEMSAARDVFERMPVKDNVAWAELMLGYVKNGDNAEALEMFSRMDRQPCHVAFVAAIKACSGLASERVMEREFVLERATGIHRKVSASEFASNSLVTSSLITMYGKLQKMDLARELFESAVEKDTVTWTSLICGYIDNSQNSVALELFHSMDTRPDHVAMTAAIKACGNLAREDDESRRQKLLRKGVMIHEQVKQYGYEGDVAVSNALVYMYCKYGTMKVARDTFERMKVKDVVSWTCLIHGYVEDDQSVVALELFHGEDCPHDEVSYLGALGACGRLASLPLGKEIHKEVCRRGMEENVMVGTGLIDFYRRCGCLELAGMVFSGLSSPSIVTWNSLIAGYAAAGDSNRVFGLAGEIDEAGLERDAVTSLCILAVCSHTGMVEEGKRYCESLKRWHVEHHKCLIDMLGRASRIEEAVVLATKIG